MLGLGRTASANNVSLEHIAERAGAALACTFSSSAEYDAALIAERRAAGVYGPRAQRKQMFLTIAGTISGLGVIILLIAAFA